RAVRSSVSVRFPNAVAVAVIGVAVAGGSGDAVFLVKAVIQSAGGIMHHVASRVVGIVGAAGVNPVVRVGGNDQVFRAAFGDALAQQVAPGIIAVAVAPVLRFAVDRCGSAVSARVLR